MSDYKISYSRQKQLEKEETILDEEVNKAKVINSFDGTTLENSLTELDEFVSDGTVRDWIVTHPLMIVPVSLIFMLLTDIAIVLLIVIIVSVVTHQQPNLAMGGALFLLLLIPSIIISFSICEEIFIKQNRFERLKEKTLGSGYEISKDIIDCPIEIKEELWHRLECGYLFFSYNNSSHILRYYDKNGEEDCVKITGFTNILHTIYSSEEFKYFKGQLTNDTMYKIVDILTDKAFKE
jgi:hypothetical protein